MSSIDRRIQIHNEDGAILHRQEIEAHSTVAQLSNPYRVSMLVSEWEGEIQSGKIDLASLVKREEALILSHPFSSQTECTAPDAIEALQIISKNNDLETLSAAKKIDLLAALKTFDVFPAYLELCNKIESFRPSEPPDRENDPSLAWFYWQIDQIGSHLKLTHQFLELQRDVSKAAYTHGEESVVIFTGHLQTLYELLPLISNSSEVISNAQDLLSKYPADPLIVAAIVQEHIDEINEKFPDSPERIWLEIEDMLSNLKLGHLTPQSGIPYGERTVACKIEAINQLRKHYKSPESPFTLQDIMYQYARAAFFEAHTWVTPALMMLPKLKHASLESPEVIDLIWNAYLEFDEYIKECSKLFSQVNLLNKWEYLANRWKR